MPHDPAEEAIAHHAAAVGKPHGVAIQLRRGLLIGGYFALTCGPLMVALLLKIHPQDSAVHRLGRMLPLLGLPILALQPVLAARLKILDQAFGLDVVYMFHKTMAMVAGSVLLAHPFVLASAGGWGLLTTLHAPWFIAIGKINLLALVTLMGTSLLQGQIRLRYEQWRMTHNVLAGMILTLGFVHGMNAGTDLAHGLMRTIWIALAVIAALSYGWHKIIGPYCRHKHPFRITDVVRENHNVWTLKMAPPEGASRFAFYPGQFQFISFYSKGRRSEEHPFTISSSPAAAGSHCATIKESGDFTATIGSVRPGDRVGIQAPFGRFSHVLHPEEHDLVFIAGGIGVTPLMSMLRYMRDAAADTSVTLLYANRSEQDIVFRDELETIVAGPHPRLKVVHVLGQAGPTWTGEKGRIDVETIRRHVKDLTPDKAFYICGPPPMMEGLIANLIRAGVRSAKVRAERFAL